MDPAGGLIWTFASFAAITASISFSAGHVLADPSLAAIPADELELAFAKLNSAP